MLVDPCRRFYALLGFEPTPVPPTLVERVVWLERGGTQVHLMLSEPLPPPSGHLAIVVDDYQVTLDRLRAAGHDPEPRAEHWGSPRSYLRDPAGNLVELMAFPPQRGSA